MLAAAKLDPTIVVLPNRVIDLTTLVQQIRRFIDNIGGPSSMSLPPANKQTRKDIHELAAVFNLKSFSKGNGDARYTTLTKTTMSGIRVDQKKVARIVRRGGGLADNAEFVGGADTWKKHAERGKAGKSMPKHREGDEVGKVRKSSCVRSSSLTLYVDRLLRKSIIRTSDSRCWLQWDGQRVILSGRVVDCRTLSLLSSKIQSWVSEQ